MKTSAVVALILICSERTVQPQTGFSLTCCSGLLDLEMELGSLHEHIVVDISSKIVFFLKKEGILCAIYAYE